MCIISPYISPSLCPARVPVATSLSTMRTNLGYRMICSGELHRTGGYITGWGRDKSGCLSNGSFLCTSMYTTSGLEMLGDCKEERSSNTIGSPSLSSSCTFNRLHLREIPWDAVVWLRPRRTGGIETGVRNNSAWVLWSGNGGGGRRRRGGARIANGAKASTETRLSTSSRCACSKWLWNCWRRTNASLQSWGILERSGQINITTFTYHAPDMVMAPLINGWALHESSGPLMNCEDVLRNASRNIGKLHSESKSLRLDIGLEWSLTCCTTWEQCRKRCCKSRYELKSGANHRNKTNKQLITHLC